MKRFYKKVTEMICFVSKNAQWCDRMEAYFENHRDVEIFFQKIQDIEKENTIFVSPSNSLVRIEGGIDYIMSRQMFPKIDKRVQRDVKKMAIVSYRGDYVLPVGSSLFVENKKNHSGIIVSPTMYNSSSIAHTKNAYISCLSALILFQQINENRRVEGKNEFERLIITSHCCGNGGMSVRNSVKQMIEAYEDFKNGRWPKRLEYEKNGEIEEYRYCLLEYEEEERKFEIDENDVKTIRFEKGYQLEDS